MTWSELLEDIKNRCIEYGHGGLCNTKYNYSDVISVDMAACYPVSFLGYGECSKYFKKIGHPTHEMTRVALNGPLPNFDLTGFVYVESFEFREGLHVITYVWFGKHFSEKCWVP